MSDLQAQTTFEGNVTPTYTPTNAAQARPAWSSIVAAYPTATPNILITLQNTLELTLSGFDIGDNDLLTLLGLEFDPVINGHTNSNPAPPYPIYPKHGSKDASYSLTESELRSAIYIPKTFTYGKKQPVILSPGTGVYGGSDFIFNLIPLLQNSSFGDPVWINPPGGTLGDAQVTAEMDAYAINYISAITGRSVAVISESQGSVDTQWALKYWPSTRIHVTDFIPVSGDLKGTVLFDFPVPQLLGFGCPAIFQQAYVGSKFLATLAADNGDSAYVPTTSIYTATDEVVEPQQGVLASAYFYDVRGVGVTNNEVQAVCPLLPAGGIYGHGDVLLNPITWALIEDALTHDGPGRTSRLDLSTVCNEVLAPGLTGSDLIATIGLIPQIILDILLYEPKVAAEPPIMSYAALG
ncbi:hypothetical protein MBLNU459_g2547t1 [Dothideomycetes sp. NU459]